MKNLRNILLAAVLMMTTAFGTAFADGVIIENIAETTPATEEKPCSEEGLGGVIIENFTSFVNSILGVIIENATEPGDTCGVIIEN